MLRGGRANSLVHWEIQTAVAVPFRLDLLQTCASGSSYRGFQVFVVSFDIWPHLIEHLGHFADELVYRGLRIGRSFPGDFKREFASSDLFSRP
jgi:hypothetical protein